MHKLEIYNTLGRKIQEFQPIKKHTVTMYHCGPTVYWTQHIGNLRAVVMADLVVRTLTYIGYEVRLVRNYTDVGHLTSDGDVGEDKMEKAAKRESLDPDAIAKKYITVFENDIHALNVPDSDITPRATEHVDEMIVMTEKLLEKGYAYATDLAIYFDVSKANNYTKLSGQNLEDNIAQAGSGNVTDPQKKNPQDFALWFFKAGTHKNALQTWQSPFESPLVENGEGFPGWHIECSAMAQKYLGDTIDIHMGGIEHIPVHHTNEIAQSEHATGKPFAHIWLHNEHLTVDDKKMAKSEGTGFSLAEIIKKGFDPLALRYFYLQAHYRSRQNFTWEALTASQTALNKLYLAVAEFDDATNVLDEYKQKFLDAIADDFNIPKSLGIAWEVVKSHENSGAKKATLLDFDRVLGLAIEQRVEKINSLSQNLPTEIQELVEKRDSARKDKKYDAADALRDEIIQKGFFVEDTPDGTKLIPKNF